MMARPAMQAIYGHGPRALVDVASNASCSRCDGPLLRLHFANRKVMKCQEGCEFLIVFGWFCAPQGTSPFARSRLAVLWPVWVRVAVLAKPWLVIFTSFTPT